MLTYRSRMTKDNTVHLSVACCFWLLNKEANFPPVKFVPPATFCVCDKFGNIFRDVGTVEQGRSKPRAKKVKKERKIA